MGHSPPPMIDTKRLPKQKLGNLPKSHCPLIYCSAWHYMAWNISSVCLGHLPGCMPPSTLYPPQSLWGTRQQAEWKREKALRLCQHCSERAEISERYQHCSGHQEHGTVTAARKKLTLSQPDPVQWENKIAFFLHGKQMPDFKKAQSARSLETFHPQIPDCKIISSWTYSLAGAFDWCSKGLTSFLNTKLNSFLVLLYHSTWHSIWCRTC